MFQSRNRCTKRGYTVSQLEQAANEVTAQKCSMREAAQFGIARTSLQRYIDKSSSQPATLRVGYQGVAQAYRVFTNIQGQEISNHIKAFDDRFYGLTAKQLAYSYAKFNNMTNVPLS
ncbi:hypothetical protein EB796_006585 [Bugula neritina]|uniref:HTH psq-type domain-containing protein n=1 Tax=Bugula neritina TaxID=10212 RepID=A0A7J7K903_BUGNE|nr:hypothetical protein EB796_006585 [Bugula neritina]